VGRLWHSGLEQNTVSEAGISNGASTTISSLIPRSGAFAWQASPAAGTSASSYTFKASDTQDGFYFRFYVKVASYPSATQQMISASAVAGARKVAINITSTGTLQLYNQEDGAQVGSDSTALTKNVWYLVELKVDCTTLATTAVEAKINGSSFASGSVNLAAGISVIFFGSINSNDTWTVYFDDIAVNDDSGSFQNSYPGSAKIIHLKPNANGDNSGWDATNGYLEIDETTPDDASTTISTGTLDAIQDVNIEPPTYLGTSDTINVVSVGVRFRMESGIDGADFCLRIKASSGGTVEESSSISYNSLTAVTNAIAAPRNYALTLYDLPGASTTAWTKSDLTGTQIGVRCTSASGTAVQISTLWLLVDYTPATDSSTTLEVLTGSIAANTAIGLQEIISGLSWTPKAIILTTNMQTADGSAVNARWGVGITAEDQTRAAVAISHQDAAGTMDADRYHHNAKSLILINNSGTIIFDCDAFVTSDGVGINITTTDGVARIINYHILGGTDITNATVKQFLSGSGTQNVVGVGFQGDFMMVIGSDTTTAPPATNTAGIMSIGWATSTSARASMAFNMGNGGTDAIEEKTQVTDKVIHQTNGAATLFSADFAGFTSDGFDLTWSTASANRYLYALVLKGGNYKVGTITQPTSTGNQATSGLGFTPKGIMTLSQNEAAVGTIVEDISNTIGAASASDKRWTVWVGSDDGVGTSTTDQNLDRTQVTKAITSGTVALTASSDFVSNDTDGFTLNFDAADATQREILYWAAGNPAAAGGTAVKDIIGMGFIPFAR
jgi:hypothetical protein